ncbi:MAG: response regulator [Pseudomonadota bacterium]
MINGTKKRILILDDCKIAKRAIQYYLIESGYQVECTDTVERAVIIYHNDPRPDLLVLDNDLGSGEINGVEVLNILDKKIPIIMHSGNESIRQRAFDYGAIDFISKNKSIEALITSIDTILSHRLFTNKNCKCLTS